MKRIQTYNDFTNEGIGKTLAIGALGASLAFGTPACTDVKDVTFEVENVVDREHSKDFTIYDVDTEIKNFHVIIPNSSKIISTTYKVSSGKNITHKHTVYVKDNIDIIFMHKGFWDSNLLVTDDPKFDDNKDFEKVILSNLKTIEETSDYKILRYSFWNSVYFYIPKNNNYKQSKITNLGNLKVSLVKVDCLYFFIGE